MKKKLCAILSLCLSFVMLMSVACYAVYTQNDAVFEKEAETENTVFGEKADKNETVYVFASADGTVKKILSSVELCASGSDQIVDSSTLSGIENVKGNETFSKSEDGTLTWNASGKDISYMGVGNAALPVSVKVTYTIDGKEMKPEEMKGKSGRVSVRFDYTNNVKKTVKIGERDEEICLPMLALTGAVLREENWKNVVCENGRIIGDGARYAVIGYTLPGMEDLLSIKDREDVMPTIPTHFTIEGDVTDFSMEMTVTVVTSEPFGKIDADAFGVTGMLENGVDQICEAVSQLTDGAKELFEGLGALEEKTGELILGVKKLTDGAQKLAEGVANLDNGAAKLDDGSKSLADGLGKITENYEELNGGAEQIFDALLKTARDQLTGAGLEVPELTKDNYITVLEQVEQSLDEETVKAAVKQAVEAAIEEKRGQITAAVTEAVRTEVREKVKETVFENVRAQVAQAVRETVGAEVRAAVETQVKEQVLAAAEMDLSSYNEALNAGMIDKTTKAQIDGAVAAKMNSDQVQQAIESKIDEQVTNDGVKALIEAKTKERMASDAVKALIESQTDEQMKTEAVRTAIEENTEKQISILIEENMSSDAVTEKLFAAAAGRKKVGELIVSLKSVETFCEGIKDYTAAVETAKTGADQLYAGVSKLKAGSAALKTGASQLKEGLETLESSLPAMKDGVQALKNGEKTLYDGMETFRKEAVDRLVKLAKEDLSVLTERLRASAELAREYNTYSGLADGMTGSVKYIIRTEEI
ncbi:MAG: hypothetical protein IJU52_07980 [Clostridia bacterium]|nr:hypothetical protein [Clostridia bacterium]